MTVPGLRLRLGVKVFIAQKHEGSGLQTSVPHS